MKKSLLPKMTGVVVTDKDGTEVEVLVKLLEQDGMTYTFLSDRDRMGPSSVARNALAFISQLVERMELDSDTTQFYRHIHTPETGSVFGHFTLAWKDSRPANYTFRMLSDVEDGRGIKHIIEEAKPVAISYRQMKNLAITA